MITIYYHCLGMTEADEKFLKNSLQELSQRLKEEPIKLEINIRRLRDEPELTKKVDGTLNLLSDPSYMFSVWSGRITGLFWEFDLIAKNCTAKLLVYCSSDSPIAIVAKREQPSAVWGAAISPLAAVYELDNKVAIWHEALHLLGADDCYIEDDPSRKKSDCNLDGCIMEFGVLESKCENWPFLCDKNVKKLKEPAEKGKKSTQSQ